MKKLLLFGTLVLVFIVLFFGLRSWNMSTLEASLKDATLTNGLLAEPVRFDGETYRIPPTKIYPSGLGTTDLPAIDAPKFVSVSEADNMLADEVYGIATHIDGVARFYSYQILNWHEVVNDQIGETKFAVTYCPLCRSAVIYNRVVNGSERHFEATGDVYNNNTILRDRETGTQWLQLRGEAIAGKEIGTMLVDIPSVALTWQDFKEGFPNGEVLSTETGVIRDYTRHPYTSYDTAKTVYFPIDYNTNALGPKWLVKGIISEDRSKQMVFSYTVLAGTIVQNEQFDERPIVTLYNDSQAQARIYDRTITDTNGTEQVLTFAFDFDKKKITDEETGSEWNSAGLAIAGKLKGTQLTWINGREAFWMCWSSQFPDAVISRVTNIDESAAE